MSFEISLRPSRDAGGADYRDAGHSDGVELASMRKPQEIPESELRLGHLQTKAKAREEHLVVAWEENDPDNPKNWTRIKRWYITILASILTLNATFSSSAPAGVIPALMSDFHVSRETAILVLSLFVAGYCVGPMLWGPLSEHYGRKPIFVATFSLYTIFQIVNALSKNMGSVLAVRLLGGIFAAGPLSNSGAVIGDIWDPSTRGKALALFTLAPFAGPALGPTISGYFMVSNIHWHWVFWLMAITSGICLLLIVFTLPETHAPLLLVEKARRLRHVTGRLHYVAPMELDRKPFLKRLEGILLRPFRVLFSEPMLLAITVYMSFMYGCLYFLFEAYPIVFAKSHQLNIGESGLMLFNLPIGGVIGILTYLYWFNPRYVKAIQKHAPNPVPPEVRLEMALIGAPLFALSFFWFGWTSFPGVPLEAPFLSGILMGWAVYLVFLALINYIVDAYLAVAASALAANTVCRSLTGAAFPLFTKKMYESMTPRWASILIGCLATILLPLPFILIKFGPRLRKHSRYAPTKQAETSPPADSVQAVLPAVRRNIGPPSLISHSSSFVHTPVARTSSQILPPEAFDISLQTMQPAKLSV